MTEQRGVDVTGIAAAVVVAIVAALVGVCAAWVSRGVWRVGDVVLPWGLVLAAVASAAGVRAVGTLRGWLPYVAAGGWVVGVLVLMSRGDNIVAGDLLGYGFLLGATVAVVGSALWGGARA